jgi:hypothetical protein
MSGRLIAKLRQKVDAHRRATQALVEEMCRVRTVLLKKGEVDLAKAVEQACVRTHKIEEVFENVDTCLLEDA